MKDNIKKIPFFYYWQQTLREGIKVKYPVENFLSKHKFIPIVPLYFYLNDCASIIYSSVNKSRNKLQWSKEMIEQVDREISKISFLNGYSYDD